MQIELTEQCSYHLDTFYLFYVFRHSKILNIATVRYPTVSNSQQLYVINISTKNQYLAIERIYSQDVIILISFLIQRLVRIHTLKLP